MIYELYGVPGAGKTTLINKVKSTDAVTYSRNIGIKGMILSVLKMVSVYMPSSMKYKRKIRKIIGNREMTPYYTNTSVTRNINNIVMVAFGYKHLSGTIYVDEGIFHRIMTFSINYNLGIQDAIKIANVFSDCMENVKSYYLKVPTDECFESIKKRNRHETEMDELRDDKLHLFLKKYEVFSNVIAKTYNHRIITRENYSELQA